MMKKYIAPAVDTHSVVPQNMMAVSFKVNDGETSEQLTNSEHTDWNVWDD